MEIRKVKLGIFIEPLSKKCGISDLTIYDVSGINRNKEFFEPSKQIGKDTSNYKLVPPNYFACNLMHIGRDVVLPIALNNTSKDKYVSPAYTVFKIADENLILSKYLFMLLKSSEKDRYFWFHCDSSVRDGMDWDTFCDVEIDIPTIEIQKKYVDVYESLLHNLKVYESKLEDLKLVCDGYIEEVRKKSQVESIGKYIVKRDEKNLDGEELVFKGIGLNGIIEPNQTRTIESMKKCNIFYKDDFIYAPSSFKNGVVEYNDIYDKALCTEEYRVFYIKDKEKLNPYYLLMWLKRKELGRSIDFYVIDSVRNRFQFDNMKTINIPIPDIQIQNDIAKIYNNYRRRLGFVKKIRNYVNDICPILIKGAIDECR
ncbi:MAG: restriction endonuclease subunit S [Lachnospiraceae bacterium]|nr:restriction endonuclease subunit S [Lachnospiraceae bacterium]